MQEVYSECTCCYKALTQDELQLNKDKDNFYYAICNDCLDKYTDKIFDIINEEK